MENIITKRDLVKVLNNRIVANFRKGFVEALKELFNNPDNLSQYQNRVFVHTVRNIELTDDLRRDIHASLLNDFGFTGSDIKKITLSSDDNPCLMIDFSLFNLPNQI